MVSNGSEFSRKTDSKLNVIQISIETEFYLLQIFNVISSTSWSCFLKLLSSPSGCVLILTEFSQRELTPIILLCNSCAMHPMRQENSNEFQTLRETLPRIHLVFCDPLSLRKRKWLMLYQTLTQLWIKFCSLWILMI